MNVCKKEFGILPRMLFVTMNAWTTLTLQQSVITYYNKCHVTLMQETEVWIQFSISLKATTLYAFKSAH